MQQTSSGCLANSQAAEAAPACCGSHAESVEVKQATVDAWPAIGGRSLSQTHVCNQVVHNCPLLVETTCIFRIAIYFSVSRHLNLFGPLLFSSLFSYPPLFSTIGTIGDNTRIIISYGRGNRVSANDGRAICADASAVTPGTISYFKHSQSESGQSPPLASTAHEEVVWQGADSRCLQPVCGDCRVIAALCLPAFLGLAAGPVLEIIGFFRCWLRAAVEPACTAAPRQKPPLTSPPRFG
jgi:hypothetical protein